MTKQRRIFSQEFKQEAVALVQDPDNIRDFLRATHNSLVVLSPARSISPAPVCG
jgi:transposase-like protein